MTAHDPCEYIRGYYDMPWLRIGVTVATSSGLGEVADADSYVHVRLHGSHHTTPYHPHDVDLAEHYVEPPRLPRRSEPERVTEHTRRSDREVRCCACGELIRPGQRYRQRVGVQAEWCDGGWSLERIHVECVPSTKWPETWALMATDEVTP